MTQHELKRTIKMQTKFKDIAQYYLGTGLKTEYIKIDYKLCL